MHIFLCTAHTALSSIACACAVLFWCNIDRLKSRWYILADMAEVRGKAALARVRADQTRQQHLALKWEAERLHLAQRRRAEVRRPSSVLELGA
jgi:hypothetical protein